MDNSPVQQLNREVRWMRQAKCEWAIGQLELSVPSIVHCLGISQALEAKDAMWKFRWEQRGRKHPR